MHIDAVLAQLTPGSKTRVRLELMHWTGMRPSQMGRLQAEDFQLDGPIPYVTVPRGKGGQVAAVPLVGTGLAAAREFVSSGAWGAWSCSAANKAIGIAARKASRPPFTVYQIRHSFATALRGAGADLDDVRDLYGHVDESTTRIYATPMLAKHRDAIGHWHRRDSGRAMRRASFGVTYAQIQDAVRDRDGWAAAPQHPLLEEMGVPKEWRGPCPIRQSGSCVFTRGDEQEVVMGCDACNPERPGQLGRRLFCEHLVALGVFSGPCPDW